jgi:hypothetical protein
MSKWPRFESGIVPPVSFGTESQPGGKFERPFVHYDDCVGGWHRERLVVGRPAIKKQSYIRGLLPIVWVIFRNLDVIPVFDDDTLADR